LRSGRSAPCVRSSIRAPVEGDDASRTLQPQECESERGLARARLADDAEGFAALQLETRIAHGVEVVVPEPAALDRKHAVYWPGFEQAGRIIGERQRDALRAAREQQARVLVLRRTEDRLGGAGLDEPAALHDADARRRNA